MRASTNRKKRGGAQNQACRSDERRRAAGRKREKMVGLGRLELPTSPLSGVRSSHLSYRPNLLAGNILRDLRRSSNNGGASVAQLARVIRTADERGRTAVATGTVRLTRRAIIRNLYSSTGFWGGDLLVPARTLPIWKPGRACERKNPPRDGNF